MKVLVDRDGMEGVFGGQLLRLLDDSRGQPWRELLRDGLGLGKASHPYMGDHRKDVGKRRNCQLLLRVRDQQRFDASILFCNEINCEKFVSPKCLLN